MYETALLLLFAFVALLLLPLSFFLRVGALSLSLAGLMFKAAQYGSLSLFVVASAACVHETGLLLMFAHVALLLLPLSLFLGVRAPSLSHGRLMNSKLLDVAHCSLLHQLFLLCFGFIGANSGVHEFHQPSCILRLLMRCLCCRSCATSIMIYLE